MKQVPKPKSSSIALASVALLFAAALLMGSQAALGATGGRTLSVAPRGSDASLGNESQPWRTLQHAVDQALPGDTVYVEAGVYPEEVTISRSGRQDASITVAARPGKAVTVQSLVLKQGVSHINLKDFTVTGYRYWGIKLSGDNHHIHLTGLKILGGETGVRLTVGDSGQAPQFGPVSYITIENCQIKGTIYTGVDGTPGPCDHLTLRRLEVSNAGVKGREFYGADGIGIEKGQHITVEECYIHDNGGDGIDLNSRDQKGRMPGIVVRGNRVVRNHLNGVKLWAGGRLERNAIWGQGETPVRVGIFHGQAEISYNTVAYNMWAKDYGGRDYAATIGYPEPEGVGPARPLVDLVMHHNIFAFNTGPDHGGPTDIYLGPGVNLKEEHDNLFFSRADNEIFLAQRGRDEGREISRENIAAGVWAQLTGHGKGDLAVNPRFVSGWPKVDLHLKPGSLAKGRGAY